MKRRSKIRLSCWLFALALIWLPRSAPSAPPIAGTPAGQQTLPTAKTSVQPLQQSPQPLPMPSSLIFDYDPKGKPDPFKPFVDAEIAMKKRQLEQRMLAQKQLELKKRQQHGLLPLSPLQRQAIEQFKLVGIAGNNRVRKAVVQDGSGKFYPLYTGTLVGLNSAKVVEIREQSVLLEEPAARGAGKSAKKYIEIKLHREGDEGTP